MCILAVGSSVVHDPNNDLGVPMARELAYYDEAAAEYDRAFAHVSHHFLPFLLGAAGVAFGMKVLDIATGTGLAAAES
jgi:protein-L-isoaspartate O-methyltransferase